MGVSSLLDLKAEPQDVVTLDNYVQPVDRGPAAADPGLLRSWQYQATGKVATANVLTELKCEHVKSGGWILYGHDWSSWIRVPSTMHGAWICQHGLRFAWCIWIYGWKQDLALLAVS
jgi:hypothetical protein